MPLTPGTRLGVYEITALLGEGGMGQVFRARDTKLDRDVAIKILPEAFAHDADRLARFTREAKTLASLNHPNIAHIHGLEESDGITALVMELVEGEDLSQRIACGAIPMDEALRIAKQIAEALEAAHEQGIIHRDLKPANIEVRPDGIVKVLDFGLAKVFAPESTGITTVGLTNSPTLSMQATQAGVILGTAAYMSPEQASGKPVDKRSDLWAFGVVLMEMLTGQPVFGGETISHVLASVLKSEPEWTTLPAETPTGIRQLLRRCLEKNRRRRLDSAAAARLEIEDAVTSPGSDQTPASPVPRGWRALRGAFVLVGAVMLAGVAGLAGLALVHFREKPPAVQPVRFQIPVPPNVNMVEADLFEISPDGRKLAFMGSGPDRVKRLWVQDLNAFEAIGLPGSENVRNTTFFWSFDSQFLVFESDGKIKKIDLAGGPAKTLCDVPSALIGGFSTSEGTIIFGTTQTTIYRISSDGGTPAIVTKGDPARQETYHALPSPLPDGRHFLYLRVSSNPENSGIFVGSVNARAEDPPSRMLLATGYGARFVRTSESGLGHLLFLREGTLMRQGFDTGRMALTGVPAAVAGQVGSFFSTGSFSASDNGTVVYRTGRSLNRQLTWFDRHGMKAGVVGEADSYIDVGLAPDGARAIATRLDSQTNSDLRLFDFTRDMHTRFAFGRFRLSSPVWEPDGQRVVFNSNQLGPYDLYEKRVGGAGTERLLFKSDRNKTPTSVSPDGRDLVFHTTPKSDLWLLRMSGDDAKPVPLLSSPFSELDGRFSPDGHWIAYQSDESGRNEVYVRGFDVRSPERFAASDQVLVSRGGGMQPRWRADGRELLYRSDDGQIMASPVTVDTTLHTGAPVSLFALPSNVATAAGTGLSIWEPAPDGQRFLLLLPADGTPQAPFTVLLHWAAGLEKEK